jgi:cyclopropane fatty-acyl-phospholipid synthase-like methyltransferase
MIEVLIFIFFLIISAFFFICAIPALLTIGPIPSSIKITKKALAEARLKPTDVFYDLGAGDGRFLIEAARTYNCKAIGYELFFPVYLIARIKILLSGESKNIRLYFRDFFEEDLRGADVIFCYLAHHAMRTLKKKFQDNPLKPGTRIISHAFSMKGWKPEKVIRINKKSFPIFIYKI